MDLKFTLIVLPLIAALQTIVLLIVVVLVANNCRMKRPPRQTNTGKPITGRMTTGIELYEKPKGSLCTEIHTH